MTPRTTSSIAIVVGASIGAAAALSGGRPAAPPGTSRAPVGSITPGNRTPPHATPAGPVPPEHPPSSLAPTPPGRARTVDAERRPLHASPTPAPGDSELDALPTEELELRCAHRKPDACLAAARAHETGRTGPADAAKARLHRSLAVSLLDESCTARQPEACGALAHLYQTGTGVKKSPETADALRERALKLCEGRQDGVCERLRAQLLR